MSQRLRRLGGWPSVHCSAIDSETFYVVGRYFQASLRYKPQTIWHDLGGWGTTLLPGQPDMSLEQSPSSELFFLRKSLGLLLNLEESPANSKWTQKVESRVRASSRPVSPSKRGADDRAGLGFFIHLCFQSAAVDSLWSTAIPWISLHTCMAAHLHGN